MKRPGMGLPAGALLAVAACAGFERSARSVEGTAVSADGVPIRYRSAGRGDPAVVFVHGWSCDAAYWERQVNHFAGSRRVVTVDLAGHGGSGLDRKEWTMGAFADDVVAVVEALDLRRVVLVGHSMGGLVIVEAARRMPERTLALVPVDSFHDVDRTFTAAEKEEFLARLRADFPAAAGEFIRGNLFSASTPPDLADWIVRDMTSGPPEVGIGAMSAVLDYNLRVGIAQVNLPFYCINSDLYPMNLDAARRYIASLQVHTIPGVGHFPMLEAPEIFNRALEEGLRSLETGPGDA
ncbi:MAG: alpha/beta hydrolase [Acidobacteria bacterium]|nr:alpha/beta hydrolase [Acidobacteriota bacterium]